MRMMLISALLMFTAAAQTTTSTQRYVTAVGSATVSAAPDKASVDLGVATQASTAQAASTQNATMVSSVISAIQNVLGPKGDIKTVSYSLDPVYNNTVTVQQTPTIIGYMATNVVEATITDLTLIGPVIDAAIAAGANRVQGISFGLQNPDPVQAQALKTAATSALAQAAAIASGLNVHLGNVIHATQGVSYTPIYSGIAGAAAPTTPVKPGLLQIQGSVTVDVEITQ
jgi:uncharacterized protein YggE